jgi:hypothetical protein
MTFNVAAAAKRMFYIEKRGSQYEIVKVWEVGHKFTPADMAFAFSRVMATDPDERLIAEQSISVLPAGADGIVQIMTDDPNLARSTAELTQRILRGEQLNTGGADK